MVRWFTIVNCIVMSFAAAAVADHRYGPRLHIGRAQFGIPVLDSFITVEGDRATVKVFSRGDITNVHTDSGRQIDVGIRSRIIPRRPLRPGLDSREPASMTTPGDNRSDGNIVNPQLLPLQPPPPEVSEQTLPHDPTLGAREGESNPRPIVKTNRPAPRILPPLPGTADGVDTPGDRRAGENQILETPGVEDAAAARYAASAKSLIARGEKTRDAGLIRHGLSAIQTAIIMRRGSGDQHTQDHLVWMSALNQLASLESDRHNAVANAQLVDDFATRYAKDFPIELKAKVYREQGFARMLLGRRSDAQASFRKAEKLNVQSSLKPE